ncbi:hypothetical protein M3Y94_00003400 [Aphelenchoides besseyi]|nr:hypothetical protein M3Y94_00003400 [Aphelenchoides besseyi]KAI6220777.1 Polyubiquitin-like protein [Aphelenchoides besseyi]
MGNLISQFASNRRGKFKRIKPCGHHEKHWKFAGFSQLRIPIAKSESWFHSALQGSYSCSKCPRKKFWVTIDFGPSGSKWKHGKFTETRQTTESIVEKREYTDVKRIFDENKWELQNGQDHAITLLRILFPHRELHIEVRILNCKIISLKVKASDTIKDVKLMIQELEQIPIEDQRLSLVYCTPLADDRTLDDCDIDDHSFLRLEC